MTLGEGVTVLYTFHPLPLCVKQFAILREFVVCMQRRESIVYDFAQSLNFPGVSHVSC